VVYENLAAALYYTSSKIGENKLHFKLVFPFGRGIFIYYLALGLSDDTITALIQTQRRD